MANTSRNSLRAWLMIAAAMFAGSAYAQTTEPDDEAARIQAIAEEAYLYGLPIVSDYAVMYSWAIATESPEYKAPLNRLYSSAKLLTSADKSIPFPNNDTLYSSAWLDLRGEPMVISIPAIAAPRYFSMVLVDGTASNYALVSSRQGLRHASNYLVVGPSWQGKTPKGIDKVLHAPTQFSMAVFRIQVTGQADIDAVKSIQASFGLQPLSAYAGTPAPTPPEAIPFPRLDKELVKSNFFGYLDFALRFIPPAPEDAAIRAKLASIGIGNGKFDEFKALAAKYRRELGMGMMAGEKKLTQMVAQAGPVIDGWNWAAITLDSDHAHYQGNYHKRAAAFKAGPFGLNAIEAIYPMANALANGELLDGSKHTYTITFRAGQFPPVDAFWSLSIYDGATRLFSDNAIGRHSINSPMLPSLKKNPDGSLTLYVQKDSPGVDKAANWLPAPDGPIYLMLRLYGPQDIVRRNGWKIPPVALGDPIASAK
jgi:hypothetical protein